MLYAHILKWHWHDGPKGAKPFLTLLELSCEGSWKTETAGRTEKASAELCLFPFPPAFFFAMDDDEGRATSDSSVSDE